MWKQSGFAFYRPAALSLASTFADVPFTSVQIFFFGLIVFFMAGLASNAGSFFTFYLLIYAGFLSLSAFFRLIGCMCSSFDIASRLAAVIVSGMVLYSGQVGMVHFFSSSLSLL